MNTSIEHTEHDSLIARFHGVFERLHRDEGGATLTEFVICLPIFILVFQGVVVLGKMYAEGTKPPIVAYKKTFTKALDYQKKGFRHMGHGWQTTAAATRSAQQLIEAPPHNESGLAKGAAGIWDTWMLAERGLRGTMGTSHSRAWAPSKVMKIWARNDAGGDPWVQMDKGGRNKLMTPKLGDIIGDSKYAKDLFADAARLGDYRGGGGGLSGALNGVLNFTGTRPSLGAGVRYGDVSHREEHNITVMGRSLNSNAWFITAIPPATSAGDGYNGLVNRRNGPHTDAIRSTALTRLTMKSYNPYNKLLGIKWSQPLRSKRIRVRPYPR